MTWAKISAYVTAGASGLCSVLHFLGFIPAPEMALAVALCGVLVSAGIIAASHSGPNGVACLFLPLLLFAGCSTAQQSQEKQVLLTVKNDGARIIVDGCKGLPALEVVAGAIVPVYAPGSVATLTLAESDANQFCQRVLATQPSVVTP